MYRYYKVYSDKNDVLKYLSDKNDVDILYEGSSDKPWQYFNKIEDALLTVFVLLVNEDWNVLLYWYVRCGPTVWISYFYIMFVVIFGNFILL